MQKRTPATPALPWARSMALAAKGERRPRMGVSKPTKAASARHPAATLPKSPAGKPLATRRALQEDHEDFQRPQAQEQMQSNQKRLSYAAQVQNNENQPERHGGQRKCDKRKHRHVTTRPELRAAVLRQG